MAIIKDYDLQVHFSIFQFIVLDSHQPHQPRFQPKITQSYPPGEHSGGFIIEKESNRAKKRANIGLAFIRWPGKQDSKRMLMLLSVGCCVNRHLLANPFAMFTSWGDHSLFCHTQVAKIINSNNQSLAFPFCRRKVFGQLLVANQFPFFSIWNSHNAPHILDDSLQGEGYALSLSPCLWVCTGCRCHASCWCIVRYGFLLASGVLGDGRGGGGQRRTGSKLAQPSAPHMGTNTPLNHGLHILL